MGKVDDFIIEKCPAIVLALSGVCLTLVALGVTNA